MVEKIADIERVFQDISNADTVRSLLPKNGELTHTNFSTVHLSHKSQKFDLKMQLEELETKSLFLERLCKENLDSINPEIEGSSNSLKKISMQENQDIEEMEELIESQADSLLSRQKLLEENLSVMEKKLTALKNKKQEYEVLKAQEEEMSKELSDKACSIENASEQKENKLQMDLAIRECNSAIDSIKHFIELKIKEIAKLDAYMNHLRSIAQSLKESMTNQNNKLQEDLAWLQEAVKTITKLGGVTLKDITADSLVLEIPASVCETNKATPLELTLNFKLDRGRAVLGGASVNMESFSIADLVEEAAGTTDVRGFFREVKNRFANHSHLLEELEELQKMYPLDWDDGHVRVMLGRSGKVVCTLSVPRGYPAQRGIKVIGVEGAEYDAHFNTQTHNSNLSQWLEHLQNYFSGGVPCSVQD